MDHLQDFASVGFALLKGFLDSREVAEVQILVASLLPMRRDGACTRPHNTLSPLRWNDRIVELVLTSERRLRVLNEVLRADDLKWISGYISTKEAHSPALWWHQDWWCWDHVASYRRRAPQVATLCYLTATDVNNAALRVLPGSHLKSAPIHALLLEAHGHAAGDLEPEHVAMSDLPDQITLCLSAGDAVAIDYRLLHGTHANASDTRRDCILLSLTPSWQQLPDDIKAHLIQHPAQPSEEEILEVDPKMSKCLPAYQGPRRSLSLNRNAPPRFEVV
jgi:ectoine hydroxylase-related dioxygenase (phytanoyl-CoA dioxygenase family)